jgi:hypothetical protein
MKEDETMRKWALYAAILFMLPVLACSLSVDIGGQPSEPTAQVSPTDLPIEILPTQLATLEPPSPVAPTPSPVLPTPTVPNWPVVMADDFDDPDSGFVHSSDAERKLSYEDGEYRVGVIPEDRVAWSSRPGHVSDFVMEVAVRADSEAGFAGVIFRKQGDLQAYAFAVTTDGQYGLMKFGQVAETILEWRDSSDIRTGAETNRLRVTCVGATVTLYVNGQYLDTVRDTMFPEGTVGIIVGTRVGETHALFHFDNLRVYAATPLVPSTPTATSPAASTATLVPPIPTATRGPSEFDPIVFASGLSPELDPDPPGMSFAYGINKVYAVWACRGMYPGLEITHTWYHEGREVASGTFAWEEEKERGREYVSLDYPDDAPLPPGNYRLELYVGGQLLQSGTFAIQ